MKLSSDLYMCTTCSHTRTHTRTRTAKSPRPRLIKEGVYGPVGRRQLDRKQFKRSVSRLAPVCTYIDLGVGGVPSGRRFHEACLSVGRDVDMSLVVCCGADSYLWSRNRSRMGQFYKPRCSLCMEHGHSVLAQCDVHVHAQDPF